MIGVTMVALIAFIGLFFNVLPWVIALLSDKAEGNNKLIWFVLSFFTSWIGFLVYYYLIIKPEWEKSKRENRILRNENGMPIKMYKGN